MNRTAGALGKLTEEWRGSSCSVSNKSEKHTIKFVAIDYVECRPFSERAKQSFQLLPGKSKTVLYEDYVLEDKIQGKHIILHICLVVDKKVVKGLGDGDFDGKNKFGSADFWTYSAIEVTSGNDGSLRAVGVRRSNGERHEFVRYNAPGSSGITTARTGRK